MLGWGFPGGSVVKNPPTNAGDPGDMDSIPGLGRSREKEMATQYCCLRDPMDREAWLATIHEVTEKLDTTEQLSIHICTHMSWETDRESSSL